MYNLLRDLLFLLPAETAHTVALRSLQTTQQLGLQGKPQALEGRSLNVMGLSFPNPIGLAAGLDKNGDYLDGLASCGFGFLEIGTVTPRPQPGNDKPRLFRLNDAKAIINRMGFNNQGVDHLLAQVAKARYQGVLGINIGKNLTTPVAQAVDDYLLALRKVYAHAHYVTVNISSPNTPGLRQLQQGDELIQLLQTLKQAQAELAEQHGRYVPLAVKVAPDLDSEAIKVMAQALLECGVDGLIATNTTLDKSVVEHMPFGKEQGGLSGQPLMVRSTEVIAAFYAELGEALPIIGVGGIMSSADAQAKLAAGAKLVQLYTGFIYEGPPLVKACVTATT